MSNEVATPKASWIRIDTSVEERSLLVLKPDSHLSDGYIHLPSWFKLQKGLQDACWGGQIVPVRFLPEEARGSVRLRFGRGHGMIAVGQDGELFLVADGGRGDLFTLAPGRPPDIVAELAAQGEELTELHRHVGAATLATPVGRAALSRCGGSSVRAVLAGLSPEKLGRVADICLLDQGFAAELAEKLGPDQWTDALVELARWNSDRDRPPSSRRIGWESDWLAAGSLQPRPIQASSTLNFAARRRVLPRYRCGLVATARNEGPHLLDWIAYHQSIGIDQVVIYSNSNTDGSDQLLRALHEGGAIIWVDNPSGPDTVAQFKAYGHALGMLPETLDLEWTLIVDIDEYFCFDAARFGSLTDFLDWQDWWPVDAIALNWMVFGPTEDLANGPISSFPLRYQHRLPYVDAHVKTLFRTRLFDHANAHVPLCQPETAPIVRSPDGTVLCHQLGGGLQPVAPGASGTPAWINHYLLRSPGEMLTKWLRNRGDQGVTGERRLFLHPEVVQLFLTYLDGSRLQRDGRILPCLAGMAAQSARLMGLPGVAEALAAVELQRQERVASAFDLLFNPSTPHPPESLAAQLAERLGRTR